MRMNQSVRYSCRPSASSDRSRRSIARNSELTVESRDEEARALHVNFVVPVGSRRSCMGGQGRMSAAVRQAGMS